LSNPQLPDIAIVGGGGDATTHRKIERSRRMPRFAESRTSRRPRRKKPLHRKGLREKLRLAASRREQPAQVGK